MQAMFEGHAHQVLSFECLELCYKSRVMYLDILTRLGERTAFADLKWERIEIEGVAIRVATPQTLFDMKKDTVRPLDRADAQTLKRLFKLEGE